MIPIDRHTGPDEAIPDPETLFAIERQIESLRAGKKLAVLLTRGTPQPAKWSTLKAQGLNSVWTKRGIFVFDPKRIREEKVCLHAGRHTHYKILGHVEPKTSLCDSIVVAMMEGREVQASYCSVANVADQIKVFKRFYPDADVIYGGPEIEQALLLARRLTSQQEVN